MPPCLSSTFHPCRRNKGAEHSRACITMSLSQLAGTTLHSALGIGVPQKAKDFGKMHKKDTAKRLWQCKVRRPCLAMRMLHNCH